MRLYAPAPSSGMIRVRTFVKEVRPRGGNFVIISRPGMEENEDEPRLSIYTDCVDYLVLSMSSIGAPEFLFAELDGQDRVVDAGCSGLVLRVGILPPQVRSLYRFPKLKSLEVCGLQLGDSELCPASIDVLKHLEKLHGNQIAAPAISLLENVTVLIGNVLMKSVGHWMALRTMFGFEKIRRVCVLVVEGSPPPAEGFVIQNHSLRRLEIAEMNHHHIDRDRCLRAFAGCTGVKYLELDIKAPWDGIPYSQARRFFPSLAGVRLSCYVEWRASTGWIDALLSSHDFASLSSVIPVHVHIQCDGIESMTQERLVRLFQHIQSASFVMSPNDDFHRAVEFFQEIPEKACRMEPTRLRSLSINVYWRSQETVDWENRFALFQRVFDQLGLKELRFSVGTRSLLCLEGVSVSSTK